MSVFKQNDTVTTLVNRLSCDEKTTVGQESIGIVTVVGVELFDGSVNGVEVLFEGRIYAHYRPRELSHAPGNPPIHTITEGKTMDLENKHPHFDSGVTLTKENVVDVAEWCNARISSPWSNPRLHVVTGFDSSPPYTVEVNIGDRMEKTEDGKFQIWINPTSETRMENMGDVPGMEDRPEMLKDEEYNPQARAVALVHSLFYHGPSASYHIPLEHVYVVWYCSTIQNWKCLVSTNAKDNAYYEVTHNGDKNVTYVDRYIKESQAVVDNDHDMVDWVLLNTFQPTHN